LFSQDERTVMIVRKHIVSLAGVATPAVIAVVAAMAIGPAVANTLVSQVLWVVALIFILRLGWQVLEYINISVVISDRRIFQLSGVFTRNLASMPLDKLTDLTYRRTLPGRILGYGTLIVETAGQDQALSEIDYLPEPDRVYRTISGLLFSRG
jgi:uncharacterized membrane protein YdbT with pleckstrin-like domain